MSGPAWMRNLIRRSTVYIWLVKYVAHWGFTSTSVSFMMPVLTEFSVTTSLILNRNTSLGHAACCCYAFYITLFHLRRYFSVAPLSMLSYLGTKQRFAQIRAAQLIDSNRIDSHLCAQSSGSFQSLNTPLSVSPCDQSINWHGMFSLRDEWAAWHKLARLLEEWETESCEPKKKKNFQWWWREGRCARTEKKHIPGCGTFLWGLNLMIISEESFCPSNALASLQQQYHDKPSYPKWAGSSGQTTVMLSV